MQGFMLNHVRKKGHQSTYPYSRELLHFAVVLFSQYR